MNLDDDNDIINTIKNNEIKEKYFKMKLKFCLKLR